MFGKGTFKRSTTTNASATTSSTSALANKISLFTEAEQVVLESSGSEASVKAVQLYSKFLIETSNDDAEVVKYKEIAILKASQLIKNSGNSSALAAFLRSLNPIWVAFPRAKTAKIIKTLLELFDDMGEEALKIEVEICHELLKWSGAEKRSFLKQALETRLISLYHKIGQYSEALVLISDVLRQLKKLDDKMALIEVHLLESKVYFALKNLAKSRAALTSARTYSNSMYTPPITQAALDIHAGILHAEELDFKTAFSYFIEALDNYVNAQHDSRGILAFKYLLLCKIMMGQPEEVEVIVAGKLGQHYPMNRDFEAMIAVAKTCIQKSLKSFEQALQSYPKELGEDAIVQSHFAALYDNLLETNLLNIVLPYSRIQIAFIAQKIGGLSPHDIEVKLSQMILDKILSAIIDQNSGCLILQKEEKVDGTFSLIQECFKNMDGVVESLIVKSSGLA